MSELFTLPLFPLQSVLFPPFAVQLHVFEERYKVMISECVARNAPFGVILIREGEEVGAPAVPHDVGCLVRILAVKKLPEGQMHLLAAGEKRFRLIEYAEADLPYLVGRVETLLDLSGECDGALALEARACFEEYVTLLVARGERERPEMELPDDATMLGFCIASLVGMPLPQKQRLLEMVDSAARLEAERDFLREQIEILKCLPPAPEKPEGVPVIIALPMEPHEEKWRRYQKDGRN